MARLLVVEDEHLLATSLTKGFEEAGHTVRVTGDGESALWELEAGGIDLVILDLMIPGLSGLEVCNRLRRKGDPVPVLMLTARDSTDDVVRGLEAGADDYLTKPFALAELQARVRSLLRREYKQSTSSVLAIDRLVIDVVSRRVRVDGREIELTSREFSLLEFFARRPETVLTKRRLIEAEWPDEDVTPNVVEVRISNLRKKLDATRPRRFIKTLRGVGYSLNHENA